MTDEIPADLIAKKREFYAAEKLLAEMSDAAPEQWRAQQRHLADLAVQIHRHEAFEGLDQMARHKLDTAASKAARADA